MVGLVSLMAVFHEAGNGANFALVPHVFPHANGVLSGLTGAGGNLGGVFFAVVFRFVTTGDGGIVGSGDGGDGEREGDYHDYAKGFWVVGIMHLVLNSAVCWVSPIPVSSPGGQ